MRTRSALLVAAVLIGAASACSPDPSGPITPFASPEPSLATAAATWKPMPVGSVVAFFVAPCPTTLRIGGGGTCADLTQDLRNAVRQWTPYLGEKGIYLIENASPSFGQIFFRVEYARRDNSWKDENGNPSTSIVARVVPAAWPANASSRVVQLNTEYAWWPTTALPSLASAGLNAQHALAHELGHALGLDHSTGTFVDVMGAGLLGMPIPLGCGDIVALRSAYGLTQMPSTCARTMARYGWPTSSPQVLRGSTISPTPEVKVTDVSGRPVPGVTVLFGVTTGGGRLSAKVAVTSASGRARAGAWTAGSTIGTQQVTATVIIGGVIQTQTFTAQAR